MLSRFIVPAAACVVFAAVSAEAQRAPSEPSPDIARIQQALRQLEGEQKHDAARAYYDSWRGLADGFEVVGTVGYTDRTAGYGEPGNHYPIDFEDSSFDGESLYGIELGLFEKRVARDLCIAVSDDCLALYLGEGDALRWALLDALRLDLRGGYGKRIEATGFDDDFLYFVGLKWTLPLTGPEKNPLDE